MISVPMSALFAKPPHAPLIPVESTAPALDRAALDAEIAALHAGAPGDPATRKAIVERFRKALDEGRAAIVARFMGDGEALICVNGLAALEDELIRAIKDYVVRHVYPLVRPTAAERLCVVAVGGYGRFTLAPGSDIDLLFLLPYKQTPWGESVVEAMLYVLWDLRQKVGHATRSVDECIRQARADMTIRTSMVEARFIGGDRALFDELQTRFDKEIVQKTAPRVRRRQAAGARDADQAGRHFALRRPTQREGEQGRAARSEHAVLDRSLRLPRAVERGSRQGGAVHAARVPAVPAMRGVPVARALPPAHRGGARGGAAHLRLPACDRRAVGLRRLGRPVRRRALHEALLSHRARCRRPHRHRLRRAGGEGGQASRDARPAYGRPVPEDQDDPGPQQLRHRARPHHRRACRRLRARPDQHHPAVLGVRPLRPSHPPGCHAPRHALAPAHRCQAPQRRRGEPALSRNPHLTQRAAIGAATHERGGGCCAASSPNSAASWG